MPFLPLPALIAACAAVLLLALAWGWQRRRAGQQRQRRHHEDADTLQAWQPEAARVMTGAERKAFEVLRQAVPQHMVLAQVPLSRFIRVPQNKSYTQWLQRVGAASADLLVCDPNSRVLAVVDIRHARESERARARHERMTRVLKAAGIRVMKWNAESLPTPSEVRTLLVPMLEADGDTTAGMRQMGPSSKPLPLIPVPEIEEMLAEGDAAFEGGAAEPVPSTFFDDFDPTPMPASPGRR